MEQIRKMHVYWSWGGSGGSTPLEDLGTDGLVILKLI
jgi:hypothetical protein